MVCDDVSDRLTVGSEVVVGEVDLATQDHLATDSAPARRCPAEAGDRRSGVRGVLPTPVPEPLLEVDTQHHGVIRAQVIGLFDAWVVAHPDSCTLRWVLWRESSSNSVAVRFCRAELTWSSSQAR